MPSEQSRVASAVGCLSRVCGCGCQKREEKEEEEGAGRSGEAPDIQDNAGHPRMPLTHT